MIFIYLGGGVFRHYVKCIQTIRLKVHIKINVNIIKNFAISNILLHHLIYRFMFDDHK